ncbi:MAG: ATP-binding protein [Kiritimatiellia bacterium]|jgi:PAS domain S-box-containing protein|nr:ATP-binding protein [Kiritimatiellia bacterium]MDP6631197.1 ATP-binding protein [Kiritimatiellia bacterium]MDP6809781.1 ATP-binding protein [Kiritimatiellia bacterium]MDP7025109.1 ATP-binding protein [Kiritimatiellia bacterium]
MDEDKKDTGDLLRDVEALHERARVLHDSLSAEETLDIGQLRDELGAILSECASGLCMAGKQFAAEIDQRRATELELRKERDRISQYLDITGAIVVVLNRDGVVVLINQAGCDVLECEESDIVAHDWFENFVPEDDRAERRAAFGQLMAGEVENVKRYENHVMTRRRGRRMIAWRNALVYDEDGAVSGTLSSGDDITDQRRLEAALRESERLDAVGALAETVSQNFGNVLTAIDGYASFLVDSLIPDTRAHRHAQRIVEATRHASELTRRLMHVAKASAPGSGDVESVPLDDVVRRTFELLDHVFVPRNVQAVVKPASLPHVEADADQLIDVLMSIMTNSAEAMPQGGTITVDTIERRILKPRVNPKAKGGVFVGLRIRDTGVGMSRSVARHIFEPLFTTKEGSQSLGLGLSLAQSIAQGMGGWIDVRSREGVGTIFRVFLRKDTEKREEKPVSLEGKSVLVADDSPEDLLLMRTALQEAGFTVYFASDASTALRAFRERSEEISLAIIDFMMPTSGGVALPEQILGTDPQAAIVVTSGFSRDYVREHLSSSSWTFLQKPYSGEQFTETVTRVLKRHEQKR